MAKAEEKKDWTPDQPLEDEEDEQETQRKAKAVARLNFLSKQLETPQTKKNGGGKKSLW